MTSRGAGVRDGATGAWQGRFVGPLLAANVFMVGLTVTLLTAGTMRADQRESAARVMDQRTSVARVAVAGEAGRYRDLLQTVAAGLGTNARLTAGDFATATVPLGAAGLLGATSVAYVVPARADEVPATQAFWRGRGATGLRLAPSGTHPEHYFSVFSRVLNNGSPAVPGLDVAPSAEATAALTESRRTGRPAVSDTYVLLRDRGLPPDRQQLSFLFVAPVYAPAAAPGRFPEFRGWVAMGLRGQDFLGSVLGTASQGLLDGELYATNGDGRRVQVAGYDVRGGRDLTRVATFPVADRQWTLVTAASAGNLPGAHSSLPVIVLSGGLSITLMLSCLVWVLATGRSRARAQVLVATAELSAAEAESRRQAGLLGAIMSSLGVGVGVVDESGAVLLDNPAARAMLGLADPDHSGPAWWQEHYGMFRPDGHTPFPTEEMPFVRALRGEASDDVEIFIRNAHRPEGVLVSISGRPLDANAAGRHGAVAVFHDITELRRYETDLAVFAGVVAHDLKAPLSVIRGHCETVSDDLADAPGSPAVAEARHTLGRIVDNADRMAALIDTLLAYTTSRDAPLKLGTVPLGPLVGEVIEHRTETPLPDGAAPPNFYLGPLPDVRADAGMLRHVLDNLIGNALKYVPVGGHARIDVTAGDGEPGWTRVEIADRGIGIPDEDKPNIFESFHRARTAVGYAGTGLGLAICRRIVERHGGAIGVTDNPGGGTRIHFTLPLATARERADREADVTALNRALAERAAVEESRPVSLSPVRPAGAAAEPPHTPGAERAGTA